jgi:peptidylprolyl isomerase
VVTVVVDGYHAPLASGAFVAQAASGNFDNLKVGYNEELIVGMEKPKSGVGGKSGGGIGGGVEGGVPLELFYRSDAEPTYGISQDDDGRGTDNQVLPFQAFGALGMSHPDEDVDGNEGAQFFFVKYDQVLLFGVEKERMN